MLQTITVIWTLLKQSPFAGSPLIKTALLVVPSTLVPNWDREFRKWLGYERLKTKVVGEAKDVGEFELTTKMNPVLILSYETAQRCMDKLKDINFDLLVCDEDSKTYQGLLSLGIKRRLLLTGTPVQNNLGEMFALVDFVCPRLLGSYPTFRSVTEKAILSGRKENADPADVAKGEARARELNDRLKPILLRRTSDLYTGLLPPKRELILFCRPSPLQERLYEELGRRLLSLAFTGSGREDPLHLQALQLLQKLCDHPAILAHALRAKAEVEITELEAAALAVFHAHSGEMEANRLDIDESGKLSVLFDLLGALRRDFPGEKVVIVSSHIKTMSMIEKLCLDQGYNLLRLDGSTSKTDRDQAVRLFNNKNDDTFVFLLSLKAGGVGLNLIGGNHLILFETDWNPAHDKQAMARIWREGQALECHIYRLVTAGTLEERQLQRQEAKSGLSGTVLAESGGDKGGAGLSTDQLRDLFRLHRLPDCLSHAALKCPCDGRGGGEGGWGHYLPDSATELSELRSRPAALAYAFFRTNAEHDSQLDYYGNKLATCSSDRTVKIFEVRPNGQTFPVAELNGHEGPVWQLAWAHPMYESLLATASYDHRVIIWKESGGKWAKLSEHTHHEASVNGVAWAPYQYGLVLATASSDKSIAVLRFAADGSAQPRRIANAHEQGANAVSWAPNTVASQLAGGPEQPPLRLASAGNDNSVKLWRETPEGEWELERTLSGHADWVRDVAWAPGLAQTSYTMASCSQDKRVLIWRALDQAGSDWTRTLLHTFPDVVWHVSWSMCGTILAVSSGDNKVSLWKENKEGKWVCISDTQKDGEK